MKSFWFIITLMLTEGVCGQQLSFSGQPVDMIEIISSAGYFHFDDRGTNTNKSDFYVIAFDRSSNKYMVASYKRVSSQQTYKPETSKKKIKDLSKYNGLAV